MHPQLEYYQGVRLDALALLGEIKYQRVIELGAGSGNTLGHMKKKGTAQFTHAIDQSELAAKSRNPLVDRYELGDVQSADFKLEGQYNLILALDVLEHLIEPFNLLDKCLPSLAPGGGILISIPNISHLSIIKKLIINDDFPYADSGILDRTHLRFFTAKSFLRGMERFGPILALDKQSGNVDSGPLPDWMARLPFIKRFCICQHLFLFRKTA